MKLDRLTVKQSILILLFSCSADAQVRISSSSAYTISIISTVVVDTSGWQRVPASSRIRARNTGDDVYIGHSTSDEAFTASSLVVKGTVASVNAATNASYIGLGNVLGDVSFITADRTGSGTRLPLGVFAGGSERSRWTTSGSLLSGITSTDATDAAGQVYASAGFNVISAATNASLISLSVAGGTSNISAGSTGSGTLLPLATFVNSAERTRVTTSGDLLVGLTSSDEAFAAEAIIANSVLASVTGTVDASAISMGNILGDQSFITATRTGAGTYLPLAFHTNANQRMTIATNGGVTVGSPTGGSQGAGTLNATNLYVNGVAVGTPTSDIGDTTEVDLFWAMDTTKANVSDLVLTALSSRRSTQYWSFDATNSDTLLFSLPIPFFADSLEYLVPIFIANASSGNYLLRFKWEFTANDAAFDNSLTMTNSTDMTISAPSASGDIRYKRTSLVGLSTDAGDNRWMDGMLIRVGGDGSDTASGNADLIGFMIGWSRSK